MANINGIKLLHKRYTSSQWSTGISVDNTTVIPVLDQGELGLDLTTLEVKIGTANGQSWNDAQPVGMKVQVTGSGKVVKSAEVVTDATNGTTLKITKGDITMDDITDLELPEVNIVDNGSGGYISDITSSNHTITVTREALPDVTVTDGSTSTGEGEIAVVTAIGKGANHEITSTKGTAATKAYVDSRKINVIDDGSGQFVTDVITTESANGHDITIKRADIEIDMPDASGSVTTGTNDAYIVSSVSLTTDATGDHVLSGDTKRIVAAEGKEISVTASNKVITLDVDLSQYAKKSDLTSAMEFKGTIGVGGTLAELPIATAEMNGDTYKVVTAGTYAGKSATVGDVFICDGTEWRLVPSGADEYKGTVTAITTGTGLAGGTISESGTISHKGYVGASDVTPGGAKLISGVNTDDDGLGHVIGLTQATLKGGSNVTISQSGQDITISSNYVDTNTKTSIDASNTGLVVTKSFENEELTVYEIGHKAKESTANDTNNSGRTYVQNITLDDFGHIKSITTGTETVENTDTNRAISVNDTTLFDKNTKTGINFKEAGHINIASDSTGKITISDDITSATADAEGLVKLGSDTVQTVAPNAVGATANRTYSIQKDSSGKLVVNVPWTDNDTKYTEYDIHSSHTGKTDANFRFAVFKRDDYGHVVEAQDINTLDGNY